MSSRFEIRLDNIYSLASWPDVDNECLHYMAVYLLNYVPGEKKSFNELYKRYKQESLRGITDDPARLNYDHDPQPTASLIRSMEFQGFYFAGGFDKKNKRRVSATIFDSDGKPQGCYLNQPIQILPNSPERIFYYFFAYMFSKSPTDEFLSFHLNATFQNDQRMFRRFLMDVKKYFSSLIGSGIDSLDIWISDNLSEMKIKSIERRGKSSKIKYKGGSRPKEFSLEDIFGGQANDFRNDFATLVDKRAGRSPTDTFHRVIYFMWNHREGFPTQIAPLCRLFIHEFGNKLGNKVDTLRKELKYENYRQFSKKEAFLAPLEKYRKSFH